MPCGGPTHGRRTAASVGVLLLVLVDTLLVDEAQGLPHRHLSELGSGENGSGSGEAVAPSQPPFPPADPPSPNDPPSPLLPPAQPPSLPAPFSPPSPSSPPPRMPPPPPPLLPGEKLSYVYEVVAILELAGSVTDYGGDEQEELRSIFAAAASVAPTEVWLNVTSASVLLTVRARKASLKAAR